MLPVAVLEATKWADGNTNLVVGATKTAKKTCHAWAATKNPTWAARALGTNH